MKDETNSIPITEFVGLKPKMYSYTTESKEQKIAKGVQRAVVKNDICFDNYKTVLFDHTIRRGDLYNF